MQINNTPLMVAAQQGHAHVVDILLEQGANVNATNEVLFIVHHFMNRIFARFDTGSVCLHAFWRSLTTQL